MAGFFNLWSRTAASNSNSDSTINWAEGQLPSTVNGSARAEMAALASWRDDINGSLTTGGSANAYTLTTNIAFTALATGLMVAFKANHTNTGAATLNPNSLGAKALRTQDDAALEAGQIVNNGQYFAKYDAAANGAAGAWLVQNPTIGPVKGSSTNDSATAGNVGEFISSEVLVASAVSLTSAAAANVTSISLTAGDWDVFGNVSYESGATTTFAFFEGWISTTSATVPTRPNAGAYFIIQNTGFTAGVGNAFIVGARRISLSSTTTVYLSCRAGFATDTLSAFGFIGARRAR